MREGRSADAIVLAHAGAEHWPSATSPEWHVRFRLLEAEAHLLLLHPKDAQTILADPIPAGSGYDEARLRHAYLTAYAQLLSGQRDAALAALPDIAARARAADHDDLALDALVLQAQPLLRQGRFADADRMLMDALAETSDATAFQRGAILLNLGMSRLVRNRFDEALPYFERVLADRSIESTLVYRVALGNAGICYSRLGDIDRAIAAQRRAVEGHERAGLAQYLEQSLGELGITLFSTGQEQDGIAQLNRAFEVATGSQNAQDAALWAGNLAIAYGDIGDWDRSERFNDEALAYKQRTGSTRLTYNIYTRGRIAAGRGRTQEAIALLEQAIAGANDDPFAAWDAHAALADVYRRADRMAEAITHYEAGLALIEKTRAELLTREYRFTFLARLIRFHQAYVDALVADGHVERALEVAESSRARVLAERHGVANGARVPAAAFVQIARRTRSVLLSYWLAPARSFVWVITGTGIRCVTLPGSGEIEPLVRRYEDLVTVSLADPLALAASPGARLTDILLRPVMDAVPAGSSVVIVADGALHDLSFDMLPLAAPRPHYWIEDVTVTLSPSLALAAGAEAPRPHRAASLLLVGDPAVADPGQPALPFAGQELTGIAHAFTGETRVLRGAEATPRAVTGSHPDRYSLIHFAAHATASAESPLESAILLSPEVSPKPPLSGGGGPYKLYARDVAALPLTADVVTLSACRSAGGRAYGGEGLVGFAWAFLRAGARQVVAGLWDVDDQATALLMARYYERLSAGATAAAALRDAKLSLLASRGNFRKPYYWAAFTVFASSLDAS